LFFAGEVSAMRRGSTLIVCGAFLLGAASSAAAQEAAPTPAQEYVFPSGAGVLFFHVRPDHAADFEAVVARLAAALDRAADPVRRQQANHWRIYRSAEVPRDVVIYLFFFDPAVSGADYDPVKVLGEDVPAEVAPLYERLRTAIVRVERMGLVKLR
jgi:hypothetical protein